MMVITKLCTLQIRIFLSDCDQFVLFNGFSIFFRYGENVLMNHAIYLKLGSLREAGANPVKQNAHYLLMR